MGRFVRVLGVSGVLLAPAALAQNELHHYDGTTDFTSRGTLFGDPGILMQRIPGDQACGTTQISQAIFNIQDQSAPTPETYQYQVRANDPAMPGQPDMSAAGLLGSSAVITVQFPGGGIAAMGVALTFTPPISLPAAGAPGVPAGDIYVGLELPAAPLWTSDGISLHMSTGTGGPTSPGEQQNPNGIGYTGTPGVAGLAWEFNLNPFSGNLFPYPIPNFPNRAWDLRTRFVEGVTQSYAWNPMVFNGAPAGLNPNFGYAGIWPDMLRVPGPDGFGFRVRSTQPAGASAFLLVGATTQPSPVSFPLINGSLCMVPFFDVILGPTPTVLVGGQPLTTSQATFGTFPGNAAYVGATIYAQGVTIGANGIILASMCTMFL
jgi:hypothetical protein